VVATPDGTAGTACVAEAGEVVLQDEADDQAREAVQAVAAAAVSDAAALRGEDAIISVREAALVCQILIVAMKPDCEGLRM
jgi:hypothetical protein